jgi:DHA2 family multidrug resistance protein
MQERTVSPAPMQGAQLALAVFVLSLATFIVILDATIINVAIPHIASSFAASPNEGTWVITSYAVAEALTIPLSDWLATRFGLVRTLAAAILGFAGFSILCGIAPSLHVLVAFRILQGLSGGPLIPLSQTLIVRISPPKKAEMVMGLWMMTSIIAPIAGPILGGLLADTLGWRWAFYLNVPVALLCAGLAVPLFRAFETAPRKGGIDFIGFGLLALWVGSLQIALDTGEDLDWFASPRICALLGISAAAFVVFLIWEITEDRPAVDLRIFRYRGFAVSAAAMSLAFGAFFASIILMPLWLQLGMNYTATQAGQVLACQGALGIVAAPVAAGLMTRIDPRLIMSSGLAILAGAIFSRSGFAVTVGFRQMLIPQLAMGVGISFFFVPLMTLSLKAVQPSETAAASGVINFVRTIAAAIATAMVVSIWNGQTRIAHASVVGILKAPDAFLGQLERSGLSASQATQSLDVMTWNQSMMLAANSVSIGLSAVLALTAACVWLMPRPKPL